MGLVELNKSLRVILVRIMLRCLAISSTKKDLLVAKMARCSEIIMLKEKFMLKMHSFIPIIMQSIGTVI